MDLLLPRAGFGDADTPEAERKTVETVVALLRTFSKDACLVAGRYTEAQGRHEVTGTDMRHGLMYCARTFFEQDDADLQRRIREEVAEMEEEEEGEEEEGEEEESTADTEGTAETEGAEAEDNSEETVKGEGGGAPADAGFVRRVDAIVASWPLWVPTDPVHQLIKRAIDQTAV